MFKKPLGNLKTSGQHSSLGSLYVLTRFAAPLRSSDRRKLRQRVVQDFGVQPDDGDLLVPEGLQSQKFATHVNELGVRSLPSYIVAIWNRRRSCISRPKVTLFGSLSAKTRSP